MIQELRAGGRRLALRLGPLLALGLAAPAIVGAAVIVQWDVAGATGQSATVSSTVGNVTASDIVAASALTEWSSTAQDGFIAAAGWAPGGSFDSSMYYEFSVTAGLGFEIEYDTLSLALFRGIQGGVHGAEQWDLRASTDAFGASDIFLQSYDISSTGADFQLAFLDQDISAVGIQDGTVTFRLYGYDYTAASDYSGLGNDDGTWLIYGSGSDVIVNGNVATIPEPGTALLTVLGLAYLGLRHRGRRRIRMMDRG